MFNANTAVEWMIALEKKNDFSAAMLADDMGLGKTCTTIAATVRNPKKAPTLIFCPNGMLVYNWKKEIGMTVKGKAKILAYTAVPQFSKHPHGIEWKNFHYVILTYDFLLNNSWINQVTI